ncbi:MAG: RDD family protein [Chloroflexi bacterium]|nr:RDD family protein [Chloroflexota bacterium]
MKKGLQQDRGVGDGNSLPFRGAAQGTSYVCAPVWRRFMAGLIDWVLALIGGAVGGVFVAIGFLVFAVFAHDPYGGANFAPLAAMALYFPASWVVATLILLFFAYRSSNRGATPGHRLARLMIIETEGGRIGRRTALIRLVLGSPFLLVPYVGFAIGYVLFAFVGYWGDLPRVVEDVADDYLGWVLLLIPFGLPAFLGLVAPVILASTNHLWMVFDGENRGWHDVLTGTVVVLDK